MEIIAPVNKHMVYAEWLRSELYRIRAILSAEKVSLIENRDLESADENRKREELLLWEFNRSPLLDKLPGEISWYEAKVEEDDLERLFLLPVWDWFLDSGQTFQLTRAPLHLSPNRRGGLPSHYDKIERLSRDSQGTAGYLIVIACRREGPYTIIDGTHRAVALLRRKSLVGTACLLGLADDLSCCCWSIERHDLQAHLEQLGRLVEQGLIW